MKASISSGAMISEADRPWTKDFRLRIGERTHTQGIRQRGKAGAACGQALGTHACGLRVCLKKEREREREQAC